MSSRRFVAAVVGATALAVPAVAVAQEEDFLKVTGGGQVIADPRAGGPGDTIAFNARQVAAFDMEGVADADGQLQVINRTAGTGPSQVRFHGEVTCIRNFTDEDGNDFIRFGGFEKVRGQTTANAFTVDTQDNGEGATGGNDMILFRQRGDIDNPCDDEEPDTELRDTRLARGNVQDHS